MNEQTKDRHVRYDTATGRVLSPPRHVFLEISSRCNLVCIHCSKDFGASFGHPPLDMDPVIVERALPWIRSAFLVNLNMVGESLLNPAFNRILDGIAGPTRNIAVNTNGLLFGPSQCEFLVSRPVGWVVVSVDGVESNETVRGIPYRAVRERIAMLLEARRRRGSAFPRVGIAYTLMRRNLHELPRVLADLLPLGIDEVHVQPLIIYYESLRGENVYDAPEAPDVLARCRDLAAGSGTEFKLFRSTLRGDERYEENGLYPLGQASRAFGCIDPFYEIKIRSDGGVMACSNGIMTGLRVDGRPLDSIWNHTVYRALRRRLFARRFEGPCSGCPCLFGDRAKQTSTIIPGATSSVEARFFCGWRGLEQLPAPGRLPAFLAAEPDPPPHSLADPPGVVAPEAEGGGDEDPGDHLGMLVEEIRRLGPRIAPGPLADALRLRPGEGPVLVLIAGRRPEISLEIAARGHAVEAFLEDRRTARALAAAARRDPSLRITVRTGPIGPRLLEGAAPGRYAASLALGIGHPDTLDERLLRAIERALRSGAVLQIRAEARGDGRGTEAPFWFRGVLGRMAGREAKLALDLGPPPGGGRAGGVRRRDLRGLAARAARIFGEVRVRRNGAFVGPQTDFLVRMVLARRGDPPGRARRTMRAVRRLDRAAALARGAMGRGWGLRAVRRDEGAERIGSGRARGAGGMRFPRPGAILLFLSALTGAGCGPGGAASPARPNLVLVTLDTTRADFCSAFGFEEPTTPHLAQLARHARVFLDAVAPATWTLPSHASLWTGLYPSAHGAVSSLDAGGNEYGRPIPEGLATLPEVLRAAGYRSAGFAAGPFLTRGFRFHEGFDHYDDRLDDYGLRAGEVNRRVREWLERGGRGGDARRPLFLFVNYYDPHRPYDPPPGIDRPFFGESGCRGALPRDFDPVTSGTLDEALDVKCARVQYAREIFAMDRALGGLLRMLGENGLLENALVVVVGDHGEGFGENGVWAHGGPGFAHQRRVPLVIARFPAAGEGRRETDVPVSTARIARTLVEFAGIEAPADWLGPSLLTGAPAAGDPPLTERFTPGKTFVTLSFPGWAYLRVEHPAGTSEEWKLQPSPGGERAVDPSEAERRRAHGSMERLAPLRAPRAPAPARRPSDLDSAERERLRRLGYIR